MEAGPHTPSAPADRPAKVRSWRGGPATIRRSAPRGILDRARPKPSALFEKDVPDIASLPPVRGLASELSASRPAK
eukprot:10465215-Alexandrium_andersonii.AAC.1